MATEKMRFEIGKEARLDIGKSTFEERGKSLRCTVQTVNIYEGYDCIRGGGSEAFVKDVGVLHSHCTQMYRN